MGTATATATAELGLPSARRRAGRVVVASILLALLATLFALDAAADPAEDLRGDIPTGDEVRDELVEIAEHRTTLLTDLTKAEARLMDVLLARDGLDEDQRRLAAEIEAAIDNLRRLGVQAFITGGDTGTFELLASVGDTNDLAWRQELVRSGTGSASVGVNRLRALRERADEAVLSSISEAEELRISITVMAIEIGLLDDREVAALEVLPLAEAWDRAAIAIEEGSWGIAPADKWGRLRFCESTDNYAAISPSGIYRGAYQFDIPTWYTVGGSGDPAQAPPEEQDARARELYARRGPQPWPECGRFLE